MTERGLRAPNRRQVRKVKSEARAVVKHDTDFDKWARAIVKRNIDFAKWARAVVKRNIDFEKWPRAEVKRRGVGIW